MKRAFVLRLFAIAFAAACSEQPIGQPAGDNNYDDPDDPGQQGQGSGSPDASGDASGRFCIAARDCPAAFVCAYPVADSCGASGRCLPYVTSSSCSSMLACGCDGTNVELCAPDGFSPNKPVQHTGSCDGGVVMMDAGVDADDGGMLADASDGSIDDGSIDDGSIDDGAADGADQ